MIWFGIGLGLFLTLMGFILNVNNAKWLLSGYNTASKEERETIRIGPYIKFFRKFHVVLGVSLIVISGLLHYFTEEHITGIFIGVYPIVAYIFFIGYSQRFSTDTAKSWNNAATIILFMVLVFVVVLLWSGLKENELIVHQNHIEITGTYGVSFSPEEVSLVALIKELPAIRMRRHGYAMGHIRKGQFTTRERERVRLVLNSRQVPLIEITDTHGRRTLYSAKSSNNVEIFNEIAASFPELVEP